MNDVGMILQRIARKLATEVAPKLEGDYAAGDIKIASILIAMAAETWEGGVDRILREITSMQEILRVGGKNPSGQSNSHKIGDLRKTHDQLSGQLIELQVQLEESDSAEARELNLKIWQFLLLSAMERMPSLPALE